MTMTQTEFEALLKKAVPAVYCIEAEKEQQPYVVWHKYRKKTWSADNKPVAGFWRVQVDYYTKNRKDPAAGIIEALFAESEIPCSRSETYDTGLRCVRHIYDCEVALDG